MYQRFLQQHQAPEGPPPPEGGQARRGPLALLPLLLSPADLLWYPVQVSIGAGFFLGMAKLVAAE